MTFKAGGHSFYLMSHFHIIPHPKLQHDKVYLMMYKSFKELNDIRENIPTGNQKLQKKYCDKSHRISTRQLSHG